VRRRGLIAAAVVAGLVGVAVGAVAARDAYYWDRPLPGAELRAADLDRAVAVTVAGTSQDVRPGQALRVDGTATEQALWQAGRTSLLRRLRQLVDPTPPKLVVDPVLVPRPQVDELAQSLSAPLPKPRRAQVVARGGFRIIPSQPGDAVDAEQLAASLAKAALTGARTLDRKSVV